MSRGGVWDLPACLRVNIRDCRKRKKIKAFVLLHFYSFESTFKIKDG